MNVAIIGSRTGFTYDFVADRLNRIMKKLMGEVYGYCVVISGGAPGVDTYVKKFVTDMNTPTRTMFLYEEIRPINPANMLDYLFRNVEIVTMADKLIIFWDGKSKGTKFVIDYATARNKDMQIILHKNLTQTY